MIAVEATPDCTVGAAGGDVAGAVAEADEVVAVTVAVVATADAVIEPLLSDDPSLEQPAPIKADATSAAIALRPTRAMPTSRADPPRRVGSHPRAVGTAAACEASVVGDWSATLPAPPRVRTGRSSRAVSPIWRRHHRPARPLRVQVIRRGLASCFVSPWPSLRRGGLRRRCRRRRRCRGRPW